MSLMTLVIFLLFINDISCYSFSLMILTKRKVTMDDLCPICTLEEETCFHILWSCPSARDVWNGSIRRFHKSSLNGPSFRSVVEEMMRSCEEDEFWLFVEIARWVWFRWNEAIHGRPFTHPTVLVQQVGEASTNFSVANDREVVPLFDLEKPKGGNNLGSLWGKLLLVFVFH